MIQPMPEVISLSKDRIQNIIKYHITCPIGADYVLEYPYHGRQSDFSPQASGTQTLIPKKEGNCRGNIHLCCEDNLIGLS